MRTSTYEIFLPLIGTDEKEIKGKILLVNGLYGALDVVDEETAQILQRGDPDELLRATRERLALRGHITRKDEQGELYDARLIGRIWSRLTGAIESEPVILPTYDCNFRCPYCFERHRLARGKEWISRRMKPEMVEAVFAALLKQRNKGRKVESCTLYGGEPLLKENMETVRDICKHAKAMGLKLSAVTNGYDLDAYAELLEKYDFRGLQITVDGVDALNDSRRRHRDGLPTYDRIMRNVTMALGLGIDITLRVNVNRDNIGGIRMLIDDLAARGLKDTGQKESGGSFSYYFRAVSEAPGSPTRVSERQVLEAVIAAGIPPMEAMEKQSRYSRLLHELLVMMKKEDLPVLSPAFCGAESGMLCIDPDGRLYSCWDVVATEEGTVGITDVETGRFIFNFARAKWRTRTTDLMEPCRLCPYIFICRGGCAPMAKQAYGSYFREYCGEVKEIFGYAASRAAGKKWEETRVEELSLSLAGPLSRFTKAEREILMTTGSQREMFDIVRRSELFLW